MPSMKLTDDEMAEIVAHAQLLADMPAEERRAAELLKQLLGGEHRPRDTGGALGMHDFDLRLDDGKVLAVEVTTDASRVDRAFRHQIDATSRRWWRRPPGRSRWRRGRRGRRVGGRR